MGDWQPIDSAPRDGRPFLALNHDMEVWVARYNDARLEYRQSFRREPRKFEIVRVGDENLLRENLAFAAANEEWWTGWVAWSRLFEFKPKLWMSLPAPPTETRQP